MHGVMGAEMAVEIMLAGEAAETAVTYESL